MCRCIQSKSPLKGYVLIVPNDPTKGIVKCTCLEKRESDMHSRAGLSNSGLTERDLIYTPEDYLGVKSRRNLAFCEKFINEFGAYSGYIVYFYGAVGTQKSTVSRWIGATLIKQGRTVLYTSQQAIINNLMDFSQEKDWMKIYRTRDLLIIDEVFDADKSVVYSTGNHLPHFDRLIRERHASQKPILFISNIAPGDIDIKKFGSGLKDYMCRNLIYGNALEFKDNYVSELSGDRKTATDLFSF